MTTCFPPWLCAACGYMMTAASHTRDDSIVPDEGDVSMCLNCGQIHELRAGKWIDMTAAEQRRLPDDVRAELVRAQIARFLTVREPLTKRDGST